MKEAVHIRKTRLLPRGEREEVSRGHDLDAVRRAAARAPHALLESCRSRTPTHHLSLYPFLPSRFSIPCVLGTVM